MNRSAAGHSVFFSHSPSGKCIYLVYVNDIVITGNDETKIRH